LLHFKDLFEIKVKYFFQIGYLKPKLKKTIFGEMALGALFKDFLGHF
jgi:hypothetical protein